MVYSISEILEAASYTGEIAKINTAYDLIIETSMIHLEECDDESSYTEGVESIINSIIDMVSAVFRTCTEFISKQIEKIDNLVNGKKYQEMMSPEMKAKFDDMVDGKDVRGIDTPKLLKLSKQSETFIDRFISTVNAEIMKAESDESYDTSHLKAYCDNAEKEYDKIYDEMERVGKTKISLKKSDFYAMVKSAQEITTNMKSYKTKMNENEKKLKATIKKLNKSGYLKEFTEGDTEFRVYNEGAISSIKNAITRVLNSIKNFLNKHAKACSIACTCLSIYLGRGAYRSSGEVKNRQGYRDVVYNVASKDFHKAQDEAMNAYLANARKTGQLDVDTFRKSSEAGREAFSTRIDTYDAKTHEIRKKAKLQAGGAVAAGIAADHFRKKALENERKKKEEKSEED